MIRGISFIVEQGKNRVLCDILNNIDVSKYSWYNIKNQQEAWCETENGKQEVFLQGLNYKGEDFKECITPKHYIVFLKLEAYLSETNNFDIHTYEEFKNSPCQILLLIYDCEFVEIYAKEKKVIERIYETAQRKKFTEIKYIMDNNDGRRIMDIL